MRGGVTGASGAPTGGAACVSRAQIAKRPKTEFLAGFALIPPCTKRVTDMKRDREPLQAGRQTDGSELAAGGVMYTLAACRSREKVTPVNPCLTGQLR